MDRKANAIVPTQPTYFYLDCLYQTVTSTNRQLSKQHASEYSDRYESISTQFAETSVISRPISDRRTGSMRLDISTKTIFLFQNEIFMTPIHKLAILSWYHHAPL
jgi:hypothetical protein